MANMVAAVAIMWALCLPLGELLQRLVFALLLNLLVYLNNDWYDAEEDLAGGVKDPVKTAFLRGHPAAAVRVQLILLGALVLLALVFGGGMIWALLFGGGICWAYSARLKRQPYVDVAAMVLWGAAMPLVAVPPGSGDGLRLIVQLGLFSGVFETIQVMRDHDEDRRQGIRTTAVVLGLARTRILARVMMVLAAVYAMFAFHPLIGLIPLAAVALPIPRGRLDGYWTRVRLLLGPAMLLECAWVRWMTGG